MSARHNGSMADNTDNKSAPYNYRDHEQKVRQILLDIDVGVGEVDTANLWFDLKVEEKLAEARIRVLTIRDLEQRVGP